MSRNGFMLKCLWVMKNEMICSIPYCALFRELGDEFITSITAEGKGTVCSSQSDQNYITVSPQKTDCEESVSLSWTISNPWYNSFLGGQLEGLIHILVSSLLLSVIKKTLEDFWLRSIFQKIHMCLDNSHFVFSR